MRHTWLTKKYSFNFDNINGSDFTALTGLTRQQSDDICIHIVDKVKISHKQVIQNQHKVFLVNLFSCMSKSLFELSTHISSVCLAASTERQSLMRSFVPLYIGIDSMPWQTLIKEHTYTPPCEIFVWNNRKSTTCNWSLRWDTYTDSVLFPDYEMGQHSNYVTLGRRVRKQPIAIYDPKCCNQSSGCHNAHFTII